MENLNNKEIKINKELDTKLESFKCLSTKIRYLNSLNYTRVEIKNKLNIRYQHVRNVLEMRVTKAKEQF